MIYSFSEILVRLQFAFATTVIEFYTSIKSNLPAISVSSLSLLFVAMDLILTLVCYRNLAELLAKSQLLESTLLARLALMGVPGLTLFELLP